MECHEIKEVRLKSGKPFPNDVTIWTSPKNMVLVIGQKVGKPPVQLGPALLEDGVLTINDDVLKLLG